MKVNLENVENRIQVLLLKILINYSYTPILKIIFAICVMKYVQDR